VASAKERHAISRRVMTHALPRQLQSCEESVGVTAARSRQDSWASSAKKIRPLEKKLGRNPPNHQKKCSKKFLLQIFGPIFANYC
jgi:hypothetical protein